MNKGWAHPVSHGDSIWGHIHVLPSQRWHSCTQHRRWQTPQTQEYERPGIIGDPLVSLIMFSSQLESTVPLPENCCLPTLHITSATFWTVGCTPISDWVATFEKSAKSHHCYYHFFLWLLPTISSCLHVPELSSWSHKNIHKSPCKCITNEVAYTSLPRTVPP